MGLATMVIEAVVGAGAGAQLCIGGSWGITIGHVLRKGAEHVEVWLQGDSDGRTAGSR